MSDRVAVMHRGRIEQVGAPREVYPQPSTLFVAEFVGASNRLPARVADVLGDGRYRADLGPLGSWEVAGAAGLGAGDQAIAIVRPEQVRPGAGAIALDARVTDVAFVGPAVHLTAETAAGELRCVAPGRASGAETATRLGWEAADVWLVRAGEGQ